MNTFLYINIYNFQGYEVQCFLRSDSVSMQNRRRSVFFSPSLEQEEHKRYEQKTLEKFEQ